MKTIKSEYVSQFFALSGIEVVARSPIMSGYILQNFISDDPLVNVIVTALQATSDRHRRAKRYREINGKLLQFSFIERVITSANNKYERIQEFYDRAGNIRYREFSPHYWLQYAIASRVFKDYPGAARYFGEAKKISRKTTRLLHIQNRQRIRTISFRESNGSGVMDRLPRIIF